MVVPAPVAEASMLRLRTAKPPLPLKLPRVTAPAAPPARGVAVLSVRSTLAALAETLEVPKFTEPPLASFPCSVSMVTLVVSTTLPPPLTAKEPATVPLLSSMMLPPLRVTWPLVVRLTALSGVEVPMLKRVTAPLDAVMVSDWAPTAVALTAAALPKLTAPPPPVPPASVLMVTFVVS